MRREELGSVRDFNFLILDGIVFDQIEPGAGETDRHVSHVADLVYRFCLAQLDNSLYPVLVWEEVDKLAPRGADEQVDLLVRGSREARRLDVAQIEGVSESRLVLLRQLLRNFVVVHERVLVVFYFLQRLDIVPQVPPWGDDYPVGSQLHGCKDPSWDI